jgi:hypothetical protein
MAKTKYTLELDDQIMDALKKQYESFIGKINPTFAPKSFENFLEQIIEGYVKTGEQIKNIGSKFGDLFGNGGDFGNMDLEKIFGDFGMTKKTEEKKEDKPKTSNLKN